MRYRPALFALALTVALAPVSARAQWQPDGVPICAAANDQTYPRIVSDGTGGAIVTWRDFRSGTSYDIYAQRVDSLGAPRWKSGGVALCTAAGEQSEPTIVSDDAGGVIVTWHDYRRGVYPDIYAQRVDSSGAPQWMADGVALCIAENPQAYPTIASDGAGGAIITWADARRGTNSDVYAQRVSASGVPQWTANGVALSTAVGNQQYPTIVADGAGGAIVTWADARSDIIADIYAQRVNASGAPQWTADGVAVCTAANKQQVPTIVSNGTGGAIITWADTRSGTNSDVYAQCVDASGAPQWAVDGVALCGEASDQSGPMIVSDGAGGAIVTWEDARGTSQNIGAQRVSASGVPQWAADGVVVCTAVNNQESPAIVSDGAGGAIVTWHDARSGTANVDLYVQRVNASGVSQWQTNGIAVCTAANKQQYPTIVSGGVGEAIVAWQDARNGTNSDIYAQHVMDSRPVMTPPQGMAASTLGGGAAFSSGAAEEDLPGLKSGTTAFLWSFLGTAVPALVGAWDVYRENSSDSMVPGVMLVGAFIIGPSLGHFYAGRPGPAFVGIGIRTLGGAGVAVAAAEQLGEGTEYTLEWLAVVGVIVVGASLVWDIAWAPHSAQVHNDQVRHDTMSIGIAPSINAAGVGLRAEVSF